jgi:hypothetical protein
MIFAYLNFEVRKRCEWDCPGSSAVQFTGEQMAQLPNITLEKPYMPEQLAEKLWRPYLNMREFAYSVGPFAKWNDSEKELERRPFLAGLIWVLRDTPGLAAVATPAP